jgi:H+/Cl- antiporter ClcA
MFRGDEETRTAGPLPFAVTLVGSSVGVGPGVFVGRASPGVHVGSGVAGDVGSGVRS